VFAHLDFLVAVAVVAGCFCFCLLGLVQVGHTAVELEGAEALVKELLLMGEELLLEGAVGLDLGAEGAHVRVG